MTGAVVPAVQSETRSAEYCVACLLASVGCKVDRIPEPTETGAILLCQRATTDAEDSPFFHFGVQVRFGPGVQVHDRDREASYAFRVADLTYWARQPVPVVALLLPASENPCRLSSGFLVYPSQYLQTARRRGNHETLTLSSEERISLDSAEHLENLFSRLAPVDARPCALPGPRPSPSLCDAYNRESAARDDTRHWWETCEEVRKTVTMAVPVLIDALPQSRGPEEAEFLNLLRRRLVPVVELYALVGDQHWETQYALGVEAAKNGRPAEAVACFEAAESFLTLDDAFKREYPQWPQVIEDIRQRCRSSAADASRA